MIQPSNSGESVLGECRNLLLENNQMPVGKTTCAMIQDNKKIQDKMRAVTEFRSVICLLRDTVKILFDSKHEMRYSIIFFRVIRRW
jgi:hypothetical protein